MLLVSRNRGARGRAHCSSPHASPSLTKLTSQRSSFSYQEDAHSVHSLSIPRSALKWNVVDDRLGAGWNPTLLEGFDGETPPGEEQETRRQVAFFGVFDGYVY